MSLAGLFCWWVPFAYQLLFRRYDLPLTHVGCLLSHNLQEKPVPMPEQAKEWKPKDPADFVRFYMGMYQMKGATLRPGNTPSHSEYCSSPTGSSAGAGSEVYHVYRHLRRRETVRQQWIQEEAEKEEKERVFQEKLAANKAAAEERTAKKRAKRLVLNFLRKATTKH